MRCLLDKNIARYAIAGLHYGRLRPLSPLEMGALSFWRAAEEHDILSPPFHQATLPRVTTPDEMAAEWSDS
jgi:hypothetical protein